jgi:hypothetical protein
VQDGISGAYAAAALALVAEHRDRGIVVILTGPLMRSLDREDLLAPAAR